MILLLLLLLWRTLLVSLMFPPILVVHGWGIGSTCNNRCRHRCSLLSSSGYPSSVASFPSKHYHSLTPLDAHDHRRQPYSRQEERNDYFNYNIDEDDDTEEGTRSQARPRTRTRTPTSSPSPLDEYDENNSSYSSSSSSSSQAASNGNSSNNGGSNSNSNHYNVHFDSLHPLEDVQVDWESYDDGDDGSSRAWILLPPPYVSCPTCVVHFCGGTVVGSSTMGAPTLWYGTLLEHVVRATRCCIVLTTTSSPFAPSSLSSWLPTSSKRRRRQGHKNQNNPLNHVRMAKDIRRQFEHAYRDVLWDEYGNDDNNNNNFATIPIVGMGHSLGARLLTISATLGTTTTTTSKSSSLDDDVPLLPPPYTAMILISFTNYGSAASIPGIRTLVRQSRRLERRRHGDDGKINMGNDEDEWYGPSTPNGRPQPRRQRRNEREYDDYADDDYEYDDDDDDDQEWEELLEELQETVQQQATKVKTALTPSPQELEFYPSPSQLERALTDDGRYTVPHTLVVQFEDDTIDQSPRLTDCLLRGHRPTDIRYARLKGTHLTPISAAAGAFLTDDDSNNNNNGNSNGRNEEDGAAMMMNWLELPTRATRALWKLVRGKQTRRNASEELRDLRQSIVRYITDVVVPTSSNNKS